MDAKIYNTEGKETGKMTLPASIFGVQWNADLVHEVVTAMKANARTPVAHTKGRGEVRGGGKKPWKQKGTGRARHGSSRSPIWIGGGITHGPRKEKSYAQKINKKSAARALVMMLSRKWKDGEILFVDDFNMSERKTSQAKKVLSTLSAVPGFSIVQKKRNAALITIPTNDENVKKSFRNIGNVAVEEARNINPADLLSYKYIVVAGPKESIAMWEKRVSKK
ncbi:MAG: 50S ribosomal protein L4 [Patescibacteria group bacterium]